MSVKQAKARPAAKPPLKDEARQIRRSMARSLIVIHFKDGNTRSLWSNEQFDRRISSMEKSLNYHFKVFKRYFEKHTERAAIFDTRVYEKPGAYNKLFQFEKGIWSVVQSYEP